MINQEFKTQIFKTRAQWESGLFYRLNAGNKGGMGLFSIPTFTQWLHEFNSANVPVGLAIDECGQIYFIDSETCYLYRYNINTQLLEKIHCAKICDTKIGELQKKLKIIISEYTLWILDKGNKKIVGISRGNYQIKYIIDKYRKNDEASRFEGPVDIAIDEEGNLYVMDQNLHQIFKYSSNGIFLKAMELPTEIKSPVGMVISKKTIDEISNQFLQNLMTVCIPDEVIDKLKSIDIKKHSTPDEFFNILKELVGEEQTIKYKPIILKQFCKEYIICVLDKKENTFHCMTMNGKHKRIGKISINEEQRICDKDRDKIFAKEINNEPSVIAIDKNGNIFIVFKVDNQKEQIHQFDPDGSYIGEIIIPEFKDPIQGLTTDEKGNLYVSSKKGIIFLSVQQQFTGMKGVYYSKSLDSGIKDCQWHRLSLNVDLPPKTVLEVYYSSSNDSRVKERIDSILTCSEKSAQQKSELIEGILSWEGPEQFVFEVEGITRRGKDFKGNGQQSNKSVKIPRDMLFREKTGRYLWLKQALSTFDENVSPVLKEMRCYYPRNSYLRYLPAVYQEDAAGRKFLERFLSIFETVFHGIETEISSVSKYFCPETAPGDFLHWLGSWLNLALEEEWPEEKKRQLISQAHMLYKQKGTVKGIERFIKIYTDTVPIIIEPLRTWKPMVLGGKARLGINTMLARSSNHGFHIGSDSLIGGVVLSDEAYKTEDLFFNLAHRFTVLINLDHDKFKRYEKGLKRFLDENKPAHTVYDLRVLSEMRVGIDASVGINTKVDDYRPMRIDVDSVLGSNIIVYDDTERGGKIEWHSKLGIDTTLI